MIRRTAAVALAACLSFAAGLTGLAGASRAEAGSAASGSPDFNSDGYADLAVGMPYEDVGAIGDAGAVHVLYGSASGLQADAPDDQFWMQENANAGDVSEPADQFGYAVADGDFNGDGFSDLAVGVPFEDVGSIADAGALTVLYGSGAGLQSDAPTSQVWTQDSPAVEDTSETADQFGYSAGTGDFNGDGFSDLAVGVPFEDLGAVTDAGAVAILYGSASGLQATARADQFWNQDSPSVQDVAETGDQFGFAVAGADFNTDGFADLAVGARYEDSARQDVGLVQVLYGSANGSQASFPNDQRWAQGQGGIHDAAEANDRFGYSLAGGDFNGDGYQDLVVGVPYEDVGASPRVSNGGAVNIIYGTSAGLQAISPDDQFWTQDSDGVIGLAESPDQFGYSVAAGDYDGDGYDDLAAGVRNEDGGPETVPRSGAVNVLYGSISGIQPGRDWHLDQDGKDVDGNDVEDLAEQDDRFGWSVAIYDFNGDGFGDLSAGAVMEEEGAVADSGAVHVLYGSATGLQAGSPNDRLWSQDDPGMSDPAEAGDQFGYAEAGPSSAR
jgi:hypothetical protein